MHHQSSSPSRLLTASTRTALTGSTPIALGALFLYSLSAIFASPKWGNPFLAWLAPLFLLYYTRVGQVRRKFLLLFPVLFLTHLAAMKGVAPFPLPVLLALGMIATLKSLLIMIPDYLLTKKNPSALTALFFPCAATILEFISAKMGGGVWWAVANSQYSFTWLTQLASVTGIWGISFLVYSFGSLTIWALQQYAGNATFNKKPLLIYGSTLIGVLAWGAIRYNTASAQTRAVKAAGLSVPVLGLLQALYKDYSGKDICLDPRLSITSPELQKTGLAKMAFIESEDSVRFKTAFAAMNTMNDSLFALSERAARRHARLICWSEANAITFRSGETRLLQRGAAFSARNQVYLLMALAVLDPGKITAGKKFMENKAVLFGPDGMLLNVFHKNKPVPIVESSVPGDGKIPVIATGIGRISPSICYDADFPDAMRQLGKENTELLLLPSGDWYDIAPYHTHMATFRAIENGCSILRQASGGLSIAADYRGKVYGSLDYYKTGTKLWLADIPVGHVDTLYSLIGDGLVYLLAALLLVITKKPPGISRRSFRES